MINGFFMQESLQKYQDYLIKEKNYSLHTVGAYMKDIESFWFFFTERDSNWRWHDTDYSHIRSWIVDLSDRGMSNRTINRKTASLKSFFKFLYQTKTMSVYPLSGHKSLRIEKKEQLPFSEKEVNEVLQQNIDEDDAEQLRDYLILMFFYVLGLRRAELINLRNTDIDVLSKTVRVLGKRNKERIVPLMDNVCPLINTYLTLKKQSGLNGEFFFFAKKNKKMNETFVYRLIKNYFRGVTTKQKVSPHMLRHTFATHMLNNGSDLNAIKELLGHASLSSTQVYVHANLSELKKNFNKAHPRQSNINHKI